MLIVKQNKTLRPIKRYGSLQHEWNNVGHRYFLRLIEQFGWLAGPKDFRPAYFDFKIQIIAV
jgi:hypothetical protein